MANEKMNETQIGVNHSPKGSRSELSDLAKIYIKSEDPLELFKEWHEEARKFSTGNPNAMCLATVSKDFKVSARHLLIRHYDERGFIVVTDSRSKKSQNLSEVPCAAMCILWAYRNGRQQEISRQARLEGKIEQLSPEDFRHLYDREPLFCKIRSHLCHQGKEVDWDELKKCHDKLLEEATAGKNDLSMPEHFIAYRLIPDTFEFYHAYDHLIADRLLFDREDGKWTHKRIAA